MSISFLFDLLLLINFHLIVLIDKDQKPHWSPKNLEDISQEKVDSYFESMPSNFKELELL